MNYILYIAPNKSKEEVLPWPKALTSPGRTLLRAVNLREAVCCCRAYHIMLAFLDLDAPPDLALEYLREVSNAPANDYHPPVVGIANGRLAEDEIAALAEAGMIDIVSRSDPERFIAHRLETATALENLRRFEQSRMDVTQMAAKTRGHLHDLSQPLSAVQGRLQLLAARCPSGDPNEETYRELVRLIFEVTRQVMDLQQLQHQFS